MRARAIFCIAADENQATAIIQELRAAGFGNDQISALVPDRTGSLHSGFERHTKAPEGASLGGFLGVLIGAACGWVAGSGWVPLTLPNHYFGANSAILSLVGALLGVLSGALFGALVGAGRAEYEVRRYCGTIDGNILLSACCGDGRTARLARRIFRVYRARDIGTSPMKTRGSVVHA